MAKILVLFAVFSLIFVAACPVYAQESTKAATRKEKIQTRIETRKEVMATRAAALKERLKNFRDQKKASAAARISENLNRINDKQTSQMLKHLDKMTSILNRLKVTSKATAESKIASASAAVKQQADNDYTLTISSEIKAREEAQALRQKLHTDLKAVRQMVIEAKQAVAAAIRGTKAK